MNENLESQQQAGVIPYAPKVESVVLHAPRKEAVAVNEDATPERIEIAVALPHEGGGNRATYQSLKRRIEELRAARLHHELREITPRLARGETNTPEFLAAEASAARAYNEIERLQRHMNSLAAKWQRKEG